MRELVNVNVNVIIVYPRGTKELSRNSFKRDRAFQIELEFGNVGFCGGRKTGVPGEKPSEQRREPTTNSTHIRRRGRESNPGHIGGRPAWEANAQPLRMRHPCSQLAELLNVTSLATR